MRSSLSSSGLYWVISVLVWLYRKLSSDLAVGASTATMSMPCVTVSKSLMKNRNERRLPALVTPSATRSAISLSSSSKFCDRARRSSIAMRKKSAVSVKIPASAIAPAVKFSEVSGCRPCPPRKAATLEFEGIVPRLTNSPVVGSNCVDTLKAFCWPGVGARKPVLALARTAKPSATAARAAVFQLRVLPKSAKRSKRRAPAQMKRSSASETSTSAYNAEFLRFQLPTAIGLKPGNPLDAALNPCGAYGPNVHDSS